MIGKMDSYGKNETTTTAMGEGAIEGTHTDYKMHHKFSTVFAYSRFGKRAAAPRNVAELGGKRVERNTKTEGWPFAAL